MSSTKYKAPLTLRQTLDAMMAKLAVKQTALGAKLLTSQGNISKMRTSSEWEQHWQMILRIFEVCETLGIDPRDAASQLSGRTPAIEAPAPHAVQEPPKKYGAAHKDHKHER